MDCRHLELTRSVVHAMVIHADREGSREAVGLLGGEHQGWHVVARRAVALRNLGGTRFFLVDPYSQFLGMRSLQQEGYEIVGIYHSHPGGAATLSQVDRVFAAPWDCAHLVIAPDGAVPGSWRVTAWMGAGEDFHQLPVEPTCLVRRVQDDPGNNVVR